MRLFVVVVLLLPSLAVAAPKPAPGSTHRPPVILDESFVYLDLLSRGSDGYLFNVDVYMSGFTSKTDSARVDWKQGGKVIATAKCDLRIDSDSTAGGECSYDDKPIKVKGPIEADLIYWDDQADKEFLVRTFKVNVHNTGGRWQTWEIVADDVLGAAWLSHEWEDKAVGGGYHRLLVYMWWATGASLINGTLRCTVNGTKKLADIRVDRVGRTKQIVLDTQPKNGEGVTYTWQQVQLEPNIYWGKREALEEDYRKTEPDGVLSDNPGQWSCMLRHDGKAIRELLFVVDKEGRVVQDEMQSGKNPIPVVDKKTVLIDLRFTKDSATFDKRINPAAIKKSMGFGLPWPEHPKVKTIHAALPPKSGLPDPK